MFRYLFGLHLDGVSPPDTLRGLQSAVCGPENILSALENSLGLPPKKGSNFERILAYRNIIAATLSEDAFFTRSFKCDPLATARLLLSWRDALCLAGWHTGLNHDSAPPRLKALASLEPAFADTCLAEATYAGRISAIRAELASGARHAIESLIITDPPETLDWCWQELFKDLGASYKDPSPEKALLLPTTTLGAAQADFLGRGSGFPTNDKSLRIVTSSTPEAAAEALASQLGSLVNESPTLIADPSERQLLNRHLAPHDLPLTTARKETASALLELPTLLLRCRIAPLDPQAWLEFLLHSVSPIPPKLRSYLAKAINNLPGRGPHWEKALEDSVTKNEDEEAVTYIRRSYAEWVDVKLVKRDQLNGPLISEILSPLTKWLSRQAGSKKSDEVSYASEWLLASRALTQLEAGLANEGEMTVNELEKFIVEWRQTIPAFNRFPGEVGAAKTLASPSQLLTAHDHLIWWKPKPSPVVRSPWAVAEINWLASQQINPLDKKTLTSAIETAASRAVLLAGKSLTIYHITQSAGESNEQAGILTRLQSKLKAPLTVSVRDCIEMQAIPVRSLPPLRRWWNLKETDLLPPREHESFSSVNAAINFPSDWVLQYHAKLKQGPITESRVSDNALRTGSILHAAAEKLFDTSSLDWRRSSKNETDQFLADLLPTLLSSQAAHYLIPGSESAQNRLLNTARQSLWHLIEILRNSQVDSVILEKAVDPVPFTGGKIKGRIDLIARRNDGKTAVIDLKLGGKRSRIESLESNVHLQLAIYGHLLAKSEGLNVATAFFILSNGGALLTRNDSFFTNINPITPKEDIQHSDWEECWREFEQIYCWRRQQLDQGLIEVPVLGTESDDPPPISHWKTPKNGNPYSPYSNLTGFPLDS